MGEGEGMTDLINPHFAVPFNFGHDDHALCIEQGSVEDHAEQVEAIVRTIKGQRLDQPEFGIFDPVLDENGPDIHAIQLAIDKYAPDVDFNISSNIDAIEKMVYRIHIGVLKGVDQ
jgi:hypothetical protein